MPEMEHRGAGARPAAAQPGVAEPDGKVDIFVPPALEPSVEAVDALELGTADDEEAPVGVVGGNEVGTAVSPRSAAIAHREEQADRVRRAVVH